MATLSQAITDVLTRTGLSTSDDAYKGKARRYLSATLTEIAPEVKWWWLNTTTTFKTTRTLTVTSPSGTPLPGAGDSVADAQASPYAATVDHWDSANNLLYIYSENDVTPTGTLTSGSWTATYSSGEYTRVYAPVSGPVTEWFSVWDETNSRSIEIVGADTYDSIDIDQDDTGSIEIVFVGGMNADTGYPELETWRTPSTTNETIRVRFERDIAEWTSANDASTMLVLGIPPIIERCLIYGAASLYLEDEGDESGAARESGNFTRLLRQAKRQNRRNQGNRSAPPPRETSNLVINVGTSLAVAP